MDLDFDDWCDGSLIFRRLEKDYADSPEELARILSVLKQQYVDERKRILDACCRHYCVDSFVVEDMTLPGIGVCAVLDVRSCAVHDFDPTQCVLCDQRTNSHFMNDPVFGPAQCLVAAMPRAQVILQKIPNTGRHNNVDFVWARDGQHWTLCGLPVPASDPFLPSQGLFSVKGCRFFGEWVDVAVCVKELRDRLLNLCFVETEHVQYMDGCAWLKKDCSS